ncbi:tRNA (N6-threonylcarbamoyladenosine(37)-N6)-methyltransferase TrmO [Natronolimnohabitans innermongolicus]|uniref:TsaA-like domain-containing protein n=1 Tax=Natronolimnohabitans innermongolicus JCM 12255 TaxID=1227499 RepID=L9XKX7_9EURY|nr:tRNA (N6-threonylcarbamoyladenosine(37)-N6)-methyltransferase TrmO [Natronolimnohabitans innermongolicus]ELY62227.1 hypothetical protein C493_00320 [Natronolimnohabitans innermongolicus JCM 12255]
MEITYTPIGHVRSPYDSPADVSHEETDETTSEIVLEEEYKRGLDGLAEFSHAVVLAHLDEVEEALLTSRPPHATDVEVGVFATRSPFRPNPIAQTVVELRDHDGTALRVTGLDLLDGTPVLDIKPYVPAVDRDELATGWLEE